MNVTNDRVLIKRIINEAKTDSGILFSYTGEEKTNEGIVQAVGPGRTTSENVVIPVDLAVGDKVVYNINAGIKFKLNGEDLIMLKEDDIYAVVE